MAAPKRPSNKAQARSTKTSRNLGDRLPSVERKRPKAGQRVNDSLRFRSTDGFADTIFS